MTGPISKTPIRRLLAALLAVACLTGISASDARAQPDSETARAEASGRDYAPDNESWNGLSKFVEAARQEPVSLKIGDTLDYGALEVDRPLVIVYPERPLDVTSLADFVIDGGRVFLADDFGESSSFLERLDIRRSTPPMESLPHETFADDRPAFPVFEPDGVHPLLDGIERVVANHPAVLRHSGGPVVGYEKDGGLVYDMNLGDGKVIVFGDPSLLINQMLGAEDNVRLVENAVKYLCETGTRVCKPQLYVREFDQQGTYRSGDSEEDEARGIQWLFEQANEMLAEVQKQVADSELPYYLGILLAAGLILYLTVVLSVTPPRPYSRYIAEAIEDVPAPQSEFEWNVSRFGADRRETNYALPLSILKEIFEELFLRDLDAWKNRPGDRPPVVDLAERFTEKYLQDHPPGERRELKREVHDLLRTFARIPTRHRVFLDSDAYFSAGDLVQLYQRTMRILEIMGLEEEYERRTRTLV